MWHSSRSSLSLLALCGDGSDLRVDYDIPSAQLVCYIVNCCNQSVCACCIPMISRVLGLSPQRSLTAKQGGNIDSSLRVVFNVSANLFEIDVPAQLRDKLGPMPGSSTTSRSSSARQSDYWCRLYTYDKPTIDLVTSCCCAHVTTLTISTEPSFLDQGMEFSMRNTWGIRQSHEPLIMQLSKCGRFWRPQMSLNSWLLIMGDRTWICQYVSQHRIHSADRDEDRVPRVEIVQVEASM